MSTAALAHGLARSGRWRVHLIAPKDGPLRSHLEKLGLAVTIVPELDVPQWALKPYDEAVGRLAHVLGRFQPDIIFCSTINSFPAVDAAHRTSLPCVWNIREGEPWQELLADRHIQVAQRALAGFMTAKEVVFVADASSAIWHSFQGEDTQFHVVRNAPDISSVEASQTRNALRERFGIGQDRFVILSVGTLTARKGQSDTARAMAYLSQRAPDRFCCVLLGEDGGGSSGAEALQALSGGQLVLPGVSDTPADWFRMADLYVCSSRFEAIPRTLHEAAAHNLPIVSTAVGGIGEVFRLGTSILCYSPGDVEALVKFIQKLADDPMQRNRLIQEAHADLKALGTVDDMIARYEALIISAISKTGAVQL